VSNTNYGLEYDQLNIKFDNLPQVPYSRSNRSRKSQIRYPQPIPTIINRFAPLHNLPNLSEDNSAVKILEDAIEVNGKKEAEVTIV
jgi:hypothetical protein